MGGGIISDLASRVAELEDSAVKFPSVTTCTNYALGLLDDGWVPIQSNWTETTSRETIAITPHDCFLVCQLRTSNWKESPDVPTAQRTRETSQIRVYAGNMIVNTSTSNTSSENVTNVTTGSCLLKKGTELYLRDCIFPNHLNNKLIMWLWRI